MYWIYIPPIILIGSLIWLIVILGKKTAVLKQTGAYKEESLYGKKRRRSREVFNKFLKSLLHILEKVIHFFRFLIKKSESGLAGTLSKIRERRLGGKVLEEEGEKFGEVMKPKESLDISRIEKIEKAVGDEVKESFGREFFHEEVIVKRKAEPIPQRIVPKVVPEDKVREEALIYRIAENPRDIEAYRELGDYYLAIGNMKDAKDSFKMVLRLRPRDLKAKSSLREIEMRIRLKS